MYYVPQHFGVVVGAVSGVLAAGGKRIDLFGVIALGLVTALGGGTLRDVALGPDPVLGTSAVFWIRDANYLVTATVASVAMFFVARRWTMPNKLLAIATADPGALLPDSPLAGRPFGHARLQATCQAFGLVDYDPPAKLCHGCPPQGSGESYPIVTCGWQKDLDLPLFPLSRHGGPPGIRPGTSRPIDHRRARGVAGPSHLR